MKAEFVFFKSYNHGCLEISAETDTERVALDCWCKQNIIDERIDLKNMSFRLYKENEFPK